MPRFDPSIFLVPIAHRGLFDPAEGRIENTAPAFQAAIDADLGIECDVRPAAGGLPVVFHDETLERLVSARGHVADISREQFEDLRYSGQDTPILTFAELLQMVGGRVPLLVEIKSEWLPPDHAFLFRVCRMAAYYDGPIALMSFDPAVIAVCREYAPQVPRGIISGSYAGDGWWNDVISPERGAALRDLAETAQLDLDFVAYEVAALTEGFSRYVRDELAIPLLTWTVRSLEDRRLAELYADAPIFERVPSADGALDYARSVSPRREGEAGDDVPASLDPTTA